MPAPMGKTLFFSACAEEEFFHLVELLRVFCVARSCICEKSLREVVEFPHVFGGVPFVESGLGVEPRDERAEGAGIPAVLVDAVAAVVVEILDVLCSPARCGIVKDCRHADAIDRVLREAVDFLRGA